MFFAQATNWIARVKGRKPFLAWIAPNAPHAPLQVRPEDEARYAGKVKGTKKGPFRGRYSPILIPKSELERVLKLMEQDNGQSTSSDN